jgi:heme-degrading monooxygenase HmoA
LADLFNTPYCLSSEKALPKQEKSMAPVYRVDKFIVPASARDEFLSIAARTSALLHKQPGFVREHILEQISGPGQFNIVTFVEWSSAELLEPVRAAVAQLHAENHFNVQEYLDRTGIQADIAYYKELTL